MELELSWTKEYVLSEHYNCITGAKFEINNVKLCVPVVTLSVNDIIKFLENIKQEFNRTISWNRYRSEITTQTKNNNLDCLIDPTFRKLRNEYYATGTLLDYSYHQNYYKLIGLDLSRQKNMSILQQNNL